MYVSEENIPLGLMPTEYHGVSADRKLELFLLANSSIHRQFSSSLVLQLQRVHQQQLRESGDVLGHEFDIDQHISPEKRGGFNSNSSNIDDT